MLKVQCGFRDTPGYPGSYLLAGQGPTLSVQIGFDKGYNPNVIPSQPRLPSNSYPALVDTGAMESCIDSKLAESLALPVVDQGLVAGSSGRHNVNFHLAQIHIPSLGVTIYGRFAGVHLLSGGQTHLALLGRTFLRGFTMIYEGTTGAVWIQTV